MEKEKIGRLSLADAIGAGISPAGLVGIIAGALSGEVLVGAGVFLVAEAAVVWTLLRKFGGKV